MVAAFVAAAVIGVMFHIVVQEDSFPANRAGRIWPLAWLPGLPEGALGAN